MLQSRYSDEAEQPLPLGWEEHVDSSSGYRYYFDRDRNITTWDDPRLARPADAPDGGTAKEDEGAAQGSPSLDARQASSSSATATETPDRQPTPMWAPGGGADDGEPQLAAALEQRASRLSELERQLVVERHARRAAELLAKGETRAAIRIQSAWWQFRVLMLRRRADAEAAAVREASADEERAQRELASREEFAMAKPVLKMARSLPIGFQPKQMKLEPSEGLLYYWKLDEHRKAQAKGIPLDAIRTIEPRDEPGKVPALVLDVRRTPSVKGGKLQLRMEDELARDVWVKHLRQACKHATYIEPLAVAQPAPQPGLQYGQPPPPPPRAGSE